MKTIFPLIFLAFFSCATNENKIQGDCILMETTKTPNLRCGIHSVWVGMKFKKKNSNEFFIGFVNCPELYEEGFFAAGKVYKLTGEKPFKLPEADVMVNGYSDSELPTYRIDELKFNNKNGLVFPRKIDSSNESE